MDSLVSVIMPVYNGERYLERSINSILRQSYGNLELIIVDDGSADGSYAFCEQVAKQDSRIKLLRNQQNIGLAKTMNRLVGEAQGEYVAVQEQDDWSEPDRIAKEVSILQANPGIGIVSGLASCEDYSGKLLYYFPGLLKRGEQFPQNKDEMVRFLYIEQCKVVNSGCMVRAEIYKNVRQYDPDSKSPDWQFFIHVAHLFRIWGLNEVVVHMMRDPKVLHYSSDKNMQFSEVRRVINKIFKEYKDDPGSPISAELKRKAMIGELVLEDRYYGGFHGLKYLLQATFMNPLDDKVRAQWRWTWDRTIRRIKMRFEPDAAH